MLSHVQDYIQTSQMVPGWDSFQQISSNCKKTNSRNSFNVDDQDGWSSQWFIPSKVAFSQLMFVISDQTVSDLGEVYNPKMALNP